MDLKKQFHFLVYLAAFIMLVSLIILRVIICWCCCGKKHVEPVAPVQPVRANKDKLE
jgi:hypothetical protein